MNICPFWSSNDKKFECYLGCPLNKENTKEECVFSLHLTEKFKKENKHLKIDNINNYIDFKNVEDDEQDIFNNMTYVRNY